MAKERGTYVQCQHCGEIYFIKESVPTEQLYVASECPRCGEYDKGLNCGSNEDYIYEFMNVVVDPRYYEY
jgi:hypothetical protein